jgi:Domain of unknown function (DUF4263)
MDDDYEYHHNKNPNKTYISKSLSFKDQPGRRLRIASKVIDSPELHHFVLEKGEHVIRVTDGGRQEIVAKFYEDDRKVFVLTLQRFTTETGAPHKQYFTFTGEEIPKLLEFISNLCLVQFPNDQRVNVTDGELKRMLLSTDQVRTLIAQNQSLVLELARSDVTQSDIVALGYRRKQLQHFHRLLSEASFFSEQQLLTGLSDEGIWQAFFEANPWIFGHGLSYLFLSSLDDRKLEQIVVGHDLTGRGKRADAVMKTKGAIEALCFVEIKTHLTELAKSTTYRPGCWAPSSELSGGVAQVQCTVEKTVRRLTEKIEPTTEEGNPTGERLFTYHPRSFLVIGSLGQFETEHGINIDKYRSFELFRRHTLRPEIITFDELYYRAKFVIQAEK